MTEMGRERGSNGGMAASTGAPCRDAGDGEQGGGVAGLQGATGGRERGTGWARLAKEQSLRLWTRSVSARRYTKPGGGRAGFTGIIISRLLMSTDTAH